MDYAREMTDDTVWISDAVNMPYIYVLFYEQIPPNEYLDTVVYVNPGEAFENVIACAGWRFGTIVPKDGTLCIMRMEDTEAMEVLAKRENVIFIDLHSYTRTLFETWGEEDSKKAFVFVKQPNLQPQRVVQPPKV